VGGRRDHAVPRGEEQRLGGRLPRARQLAVWLDPFVELRAPQILNLRRDPFERALDDSNTYCDWMIDRIFMIVPAPEVGAAAIEEFKQLSPRQKPASLSLDRVLDRLRSGAGGES
jgi:hypothetical protein